ncbi:Transposase [Pelagibacterium luteolum]|uniref:Transposase n=2 Tax=Pelagibacterium luteolum TaxID=440168 RepID=A0A1G8AIN4_9HYPH|nr:Transposase [Pelagibacterium luteolum]
MVPVSKDTLIRTVRRFGTPSPIPPRVIGIDDWAWRRNHRYGTLICDLERRRPIKLLPDREPATTQAWLSSQKQIEIVARDRGGGYGLAISRGLPEAVQVADRWHLMENASRAFLEAVRKSMREIRRCIGVARIDPEFLTAAEKIQYGGFLRREDTNHAVMALFNDGIPLKEIVRRTGHSRGLVRQITRGLHSDVFRTRESSLEPYLEWLDAQWDQGDRNGADLWRRLCRKGFKGSLRVVGEWATRRRRAEQADAALRRIPSARTIARLMTTGRDRLTKPETVIIAAIEADLPNLVTARSQIEAFNTMIRTRDAGGLADWLEQSSQGLMASFAKGVHRDRAAVEAAISSTWSNGQTEGQITKLKLVKRQMYGRGKIDLLEARLIGAP